MKVAIRADASIELGSGHVMRCLTLADALRKRGAVVHFICRNMPGHLGDLILNKGYELAWLPQHATTAEDARGSRRSLLDLAPWDWLVVDHYALDAAWERELRDLTGKLMVIDDLANRPHDCDLLLDQNLQQPGRYAGWVPETCRTLIGPKYALLRPEFATTRRNLLRRTGKVSRLLLFFGGSDASGETLKALAAIGLLAHAELAVDIVLGSTNPHMEAIETMCRGMSRVAVHVQVEDMATRMAEADLFVGAGGTSSWERCCLGLPAVVMATAENQALQCEALARIGAQLYLGLARSVSIERLASVIRETLNLPELLSHMTDQGQDRVDGRGIKRVVADMLMTMIKLRRAQKADATAIFAWRNHPDTRRYAFDPIEIDWKTHERWFTTVLANPNRELLIAELDGCPVGVLRYDIEAERGVVSIYLVPDQAGQGWGLPVLLAGERWLRESRPDVRICEAEVDASNLASSEIFQAAGFTPYRRSFWKEMHDNY